MRNHELLNLKADLNSLNIAVPEAIANHEQIIEAVAALPSNTGKRGLEGVTAKTVGAEIEKRALDSILAKERVTQARLLSDTATAAIDRTLINATESLIDAMRTIVLEAHETLMNAADKLGDITPEAAVKANDAQAYNDALKAYEKINTAMKIRTRLYVLDPPSMDRGVQRALSLWSFHGLDAWNAYQALPDAGSGPSNHVLSARTEGVTFVWAGTDAAEAQSLALGKAQAEQIKGNRSTQAHWDADEGAYVSNAL